MNDKVYSMLGLAQKAGEIASGNDTCEFIIKAKKCFLVIISQDASDRTKKHFRDMCSFRNINILEYGLKDDLGKCIGKNERSVIAIKNDGFAKKITQLIAEKKSENGGVPIA